MDTFLWQTEFAALETVEQWNSNIPSLVRERGSEYKAFAQAEAKARGYVFDKEKVQYVEGPIPVTGTKGRNLTAVGWRDGTLRCVFERERNNISIYTYAGVPKEEYEKLLRSPYPDRLHSTNIKGKYACTKEGGQ
jgi:hypothetical protein